MITLSLPDKLAEKTYFFPEYSYGANKVTLILESGRKVPNVFLAGGRDIVKIGSHKVSSAHDLDFQISDIVDVISEI